MIKEADMIGRKGHARPKIRSLEPVRRNNFGDGHSNCWICEGWSVQTFILDKGELFEEMDSEKDVLLHLEFRDWEPIPMKNFQSNWKLD